MKNVVSLTMAFAVLTTVSGSKAATRDDAAKLIAQRGAIISDVKPLAQPLASELIPEVYYGNGNTGQNCGLLICIPGKPRTDFIKLSRLGPGVGLPQNDASGNRIKVVSFKTLDSIGAS